MPRLFRAQEYFIATYNSFIRLLYLAPFFPNLVNTRLCQILKRHGDLEFELRSEFEKQWFSDGRNLRGVVEVYNHHTASASIGSVEIDGLWLELPKDRLKGFAHGTFTHKRVERFYGKLEVDNCFHDLFLGLCWKIDFSQLLMMHRSCCDNTIIHLMSNRSVGNHSIPKQRDEIIHAGVSRKACLTGSG